MAKKLSPAMFAWAKANKKKLKNPTAAQKKIFAAYDAMVKAGDKPANPKPRPASKPAPKTQTKTEPKSKPADKTKPADKGGSGVTQHGQFRKVGDPGPNVTKPYGQLDRSGASVRRNQQDARRSRTNANPEVRAASGSRRRNEAAIKAEVARSSGGSRESQRAKERRQRLARERAARRNRLNLIARRNNDM